MLQLINKRLMRCVAVLGLMAAVLLTAGGSHADDGMVIPVYRSQLVVLPEGMAEVVVAKPEIADVYVHGPTRATVVAKETGTTNVRFLDKENNVIRNILVRVTYDLPAIRKALREFMPNEVIGVEMVGDKIALTGTVRTAEVSANAERISNEYIASARKFSEAGSAENSNSAGGATEGAGQAQVINLLKISSGQQVMLRVRVGEIQRNSLKRLGSNLNGVRIGSTGGRILTGSAIEALTNATTGGTGGGDPLFVLNPDNFGYGRITRTTGNFDISLAIEALERDGLFKTLAEPNLVAISGERAEFLAGGEFPVPVAQSLSGGSTGVSVEYRNYGVAVAFTPYVLSENRIRLNVQPEVSELSEAGAIEASGFSIPSLTTRRASTTVELAPGESFMIAGLLRDQMNSSINSLPGIKEIPVLGALFRSASYQRNETELVIAVTPYLVDPLVSSDVRLPTDNFRPASTMEMMFYGALGSISHGELKLSQTPPVEGPIGYLTD
jgi:pilus assembly protein CpaC